MAEIPKRPQDDPDALNRATRRSIEEGSGLKALWARIRELEQALRQIQQVMRTAAWYDDLERVGPIVEAALVSLHVTDKAATK